MSTRTAGAAFALRFVSGKYQGGVYPLRDGREVLIGRSSDVDLVLMEDNVSRRHAKVKVRGDEVTLQDLGSTNGTFVNGERVKRAKLAAGDRVLVGGSILKLERADPGTAPERPTDTEIRARLEEAAAEAAPRQAAGIQGRLEEVPLPDLLQLLDNGKKTGVLALRRDAEEAAIHLREGRVVHCRVGGRGDLAPRKALPRLLAWERGEFRLDPAEAAPPVPAFDEPVEALLIDGLRRLDELREMAGRLPPREARLSVAAPLAPPLRDLPPESLDVLQLAVNLGEAGAVVDAWPGADAEAWKQVLRLLELGYLRRA